MALKEFSKLPSDELISTLSGRKDTVEESPTELTFIFKDVTSSPLSVVTTQFFPLIDFTFPLS